jgi:hypothetical protein
MSDVPRIGGFMGVSTGEQDQVSALASAGFRNPFPVPKACHNPQKGVGDSENLDSFDYDESDTENCLRNSSKKDKNRVRMSRRFREVASGKTVTMGESNGL